MTTVVLLHFWQTFHQNQRQRISNGGTGHGRQCKGRGGFDREKNFDHFLYVLCFRLCFCFCRYHCRRLNITQEMILHGNRSLDLKVEKLEPNNDEFKRIQSTGFLRRGFLQHWFNLQVLSIEFQGYIEKGYSSNCIAILTHAQADLNIMIFLHWYSKCFCLI